MEPMLAQLNKRLELTRDVNAVEVPSGEIVTLNQGAELYIMQKLGGSYTVRGAYGGMARIAAEDADALGLEPERSDAPGIDDGGFSEAKVWAQLKTVYDPEIPVNIVDLGLIYECDISEDAGGKRLRVAMTLTAPGCGMGDVLKRDVELKLQKIPGVSRVEVELVLDPPWDREMMTEEARLELGLI